MEGDDSKAEEEVERSKSPISPDPNSVPPYPAELSHTEHPDQTHCDPQTQCVSQTQGNHCNPLQGEQGEEKEEISANEEEHKNNNPGEWG